MSKTQLKKVLAGMDAEQMAEMVIELYEARPEAKEYLDFFISPDVEGKLDKARAAIRKEAMRNSRGYNRTRSTKIRRIIKDISSLNPGAEAVAEIMTYAIECITKVSNDQLLRATTQTGFMRLLHDTIVFADSAGILGDYLSRLEAAVNGMQSSWWRGNDFKNLLRKELKETLESL